MKVLAYCLGGLLVTSCLQPRKTDSEAKSARFAEGDSQGEQGKSFYYQYKFDNGGRKVDVALRIDFGAGGRSLVLHAIDLTDRNAAVNVVPLTEFDLPVARHGGPQGGLEGYSFVGEGGSYTIYVKLHNSNDNSWKSASRMYAYLPEMHFYPAKKHIAYYEGTATKKLSQQQWEQLASGRPALTHPHKSQLSSGQRRWLSDCLRDAGRSRGSSKDGLHKALGGPHQATIAGRVYSGDVYQVNNSDFIFGFDDPEVLAYFIRHRFSCKFMPDLTVEIDNDKSKRALVIGTLDDNIRMSIAAQRVENGELIISTSVDGRDVIKVDRYGMVVGI